MKAVLVVKLFLTISTVVASVTQCSHVLIGGMLAGKLVCAHVTLKKMMIKSIHMLIASLLSPEFPDADIALNGETPVITGIHMLVTGPLIGKGTEAGVTLVHFGRARSVEELLNEDFG